MKTKLFILIVTVCFLIVYGKTYLYSLEGDYLWIEYGEHIIERNGSVTQLLNIYFGSYPDCKKDIFLREELKVIYTRNGKNTPGETVFYPLEIFKDREKIFVRITSYKTNCFTVLVQGKRNHGELRNIYFAKTSFFLFGSSYSKEEKAEYPLSSMGMSEQFILHIAPPYSYWRETGNPVTLGISFENKRLENKLIHIIDGNDNLSTGPVVKQTDKNGEVMYIPPDDPELRQQGHSAYKQTLIVAEERKGNMSYIFSYTLLLHRSRFKHYNTLLGMGIFMSMFAGIFFLIFLKRKRFVI